MNDHDLVIGCCADLEGLTLLEATPGVEFIELPVARALMGEGGEFDGLSARIDNSRLTARVANVFLPPDLKVVGPEFQPDRLEEYAATALDRARRLGVSVLVFGSGASRMVPPGFPRDRALDQLETALRLVHTLASALGLTVALEPLHSAETNLLNSVAEAAAYIERRNLDGVLLVADLWHMECEGEGMRSLAGAAALIAHAHVAAAGRRPPGQAVDSIEAFLGSLREAGYRGACSIECRWTDFAAEVTPAVKRVRDAAAAAGWRVA